MTKPFATDAFEKRGQALEDEYFKTRDSQLVAKLKSVFQHTFSKDELRRTSGIQNDAVLDRLVKLSLNDQLLTAFKLYPLVEIAWADGAVDDREIQAVVKAAENFGVTPGSAALANLEARLRSGPDEDARIAWRQFAQELRKTLTPQELATFRADLLEYAHKVAKASGGVFGDVLAISPGEKRAIKAITEALS